MCYSVIQDVLQIRQRRLLRWAKRAAGLAIVVSGGVLLTTDLVSAVSSNAPKHARGSWANVATPAP